jgi:hypothetical protein
MSVTHRLAFTLVSSALLLAACGDQANKPAASSAEHGHDHAADQSKAPVDDHGGGKVIELGSLEEGGYSIKASRDGDVKAGGEAPIDVWISGGQTVAAVRFWIGTQDGAGAMKAKAAIERDNWHTHAEVPDPMPAGSKLWVEIESDKGAIVVVGFDLKI